MATKTNAQGSILMLSIHGYVSAEPELGKPDTGGQVVFVLELAKRFARLGYKVDLVTRRFGKQPEFDRVNPNLRVWRIPFGGKDFIRKEDMHGQLRDFVTNFLAEAASRKLRYDVVSSHYWDAGWAGQRIAEELRIPHVHTPHSLGSWKKKDMKGSRGEEEQIYRFAERMEKEFLVYRNCDHIIATTEQQVELIHADYGIPREHVSLIPPGIDEQRFTPAQPSRVAEIRERIGFAADDVYCVGRAATNKGIDLLISALPALRKLVPKARLQLAIGAGSDRDRERVTKWKELAQELGVAAHVRWIGYVADEEMADYYRAAGVFALSSRYEPFGMTAIEAMACGTPTVATVHGGLHEAVEFGTHALFADPKKPEEFAAIMGMPLRYARLREKLSLEGARFSRRQFGWTGIARRTLAVFERFRGIYQMPEELADV
ncbi:glycosyltransferase [Luteolibacter sp. GHJ8]|uniref:Glycosyltransferase n=1 Tax=Luteolibacter rhizosphaerae TaxID=2989719 RepID=A0ABT3G344_9BACT|nr:glycosyltransferase [Luteolibacter rhizosphaerae]MCW1913655.1 glycosyltransferase [Luteolibacter rhizosphaerae]